MTKNSIIEMVKKGYEYSQEYSVGIEFFIDNGNPRWVPAREFHKTHKKEESLFFINELDFPSKTAVYTIANSLWRKSHPMALSEEDLRKAYEIVLSYISKLEKGWTIEQIFSEVRKLSEGEEKLIYLNVKDILRDYIDPMKMKSQIVDIMQYDV